MKLNIEFGGRERIVEVVRVGSDGRLIWTIDGREVAADAAEITPDVFSILIGGEAFEARVEAAAGKLRVLISGREYVAIIHDPRQWTGSAGVALDSLERQQVIAPMPGKIVRVLVKSGDVIKAGQGIVVVEAMKMQNEVRSPKSGSVERLFVAEGQTVNGGEVLATVV